MPSKQYISAISDPKTPEEWSLAMSDPNSHVYKLLMTLMQEAADESKALECLLERWIQVTIQQNTAEREAMVKAFVAEAALLTEKIRYQHDEQILQAEKANMDKSFEQWKHLAQYLPEQIAELKKSYQVSQLNLNQLKEQVSAMSRSWVERQRNEDAQLIAALESENISVLMPDGETLSPRQLEQVLANAPAQLPFDAKLKANSGLLQKLLALEKQGVDGCSVTAKMEGVLNEFSKLCCLCGDDINPVKLLKVHKLNKILFDKIGEFNHLYIEPKAHDIRELLGLTQRIQVEQKNLNLCNEKINQMTALLEAALRHVDHHEKIKPAK